MKRKVQGDKQFAQNTYQGPAWQSCVFPKCTLPGKIRKTGRKKPFTGSQLEGREQPGMFLTYYSRALAAPILTAQSAVQLVPGDICKFLQDFMPTVHGVHDWLSGRDCNDRLGMQGHASKCVSQL